jgi:hypothetical protein
MAAQEEQKQLALQEQLKSNTAQNVSKVAPALAKVSGG